MTGNAKTPEEKLAERVDEGKPVMSWAFDHSTSVGITEAGEIVLDAPCLPSPLGHQAGIVRVVLSQEVVRNLLPALQTLQRNGVLDFSEEPTNPGLN